MFDFVPVYSRLKLAGNPGARLGPFQRSLVWNPAGGVVTTPLSAAPSDAEWRDPAFLRQTSLQ